MIKYIFLNSLDATQRDMEDFIRLVRKGEAVAEHYVRNGIERKGAKMVLAKLDDTLVGVAALKVPLKTYRNRIESEAKSGHSIPEVKYPFELGYVAVDADHGGRGTGKQLVDSVLYLSGGRGLFATTSHPAMKKNILPSAGFQPVGTSWANDQNEPLQLFILGTRQNSLSEILES